MQAALGAWVDPTGDGVCDIEYRVVGVHGGPTRWVTTRGKTIFENGQPASFHGVVLDISERKRAEQTNLVLIAELEHRTRNLLAVVNALAEQTLASCESVDDFVEPFRERLATLSRVQGLLSRAETSPVMIGELVELELRALGASQMAIAFRSRVPKSPCLIDPFRFWRSGCTNWRPMRGSTVRSGHATARCRFNGASPPRAHRADSRSIGSRRESTGREHQRTRAESGSAAR